MKRARIYTENKNLHNLCLIADQYFESYSVIGCGGVWHGKHEPAVIFEVIGADVLEVRAFALDVKAYNRQEAVLVTQIDGDGDPL